jgi:hypothetical protein
MSSAVNWYPTCITKDSIVTVESESYKWSAKRYICTCKYCEGMRREQKRSTINFFGSEQRRSEWLALSSGGFTLGERAVGTSWMGSWVGPRLVPGIEPRKVQSVSYVISQCFYMLTYFWNICKVTPVGILENVDPWRWGQYATSKCLPLMLYHVPEGRNP